MSPTFGSKGQETARREKIFREKDWKKKILVDLINQNKNFKFNSNIFDIVSYLFMLNRVCW